MRSITLFVRYKTHINSKFLECVHEYYLTQLIKEPTHIRGEQNPTLIDLILCNDSDFVESISHYAPFGLSHHSVICFSLNTYQSDISLPPLVKFILNKGDYDGMRQKLKNVNWNDIFKDETDVDILWSKIENEIIKARDEFIPKKVI